MKRIQVEKKKNADDVRADFPIFKTKIKGKELVYLDNTATTQKPKQVIDAEVNYYCTTNANVHRGVYTLAENATIEYENARGKVAHFIGAKTQEVIFTSGTTMGLNMAAWMLESQIMAGDEIVVSIMEHHSNFVPWQQLALRRKAVLKIIPLTADYQLDMAAGARLITARTKVVACTYVSNVLGVINPIVELVALAKKVGAYMVIDGAQAAPHLKIDVRELGCDFLAFSGHKMMGPTGIGVLYGREELLRTLEPVVFGGEMVKEVAVVKTSWNDIPYKFEAGTPNIAGAIGLGKVVEYMQSLPMDDIHEQLQELFLYALDEMRKMKGITIYGSTRSLRVPVIAFNIEGVHAHDAAEILNRDGVCIRAGHHCAMPLHTALGIQASARMSLYIYNTKKDVDTFLKGLRKVQKVFC